MASQPSRRKPTSPRAQAAAPAEPQDAVPPPAPAGLPVDVLASFEGIKAPAPGTVDARKRPDTEDIEGYHLDLPRGHWAAIGSIDLIPQATINAAKAAGLRMVRAVERGETDELPAQNTALSAAVLAHLVTGWSLAHPLPVTAQTLERLPAVIAGRLEAAAERALKAVRAEIEPSMDPASPTPPSAG
jgi:hypothetical protein